jgi:type IV secretion system protein VirD4
MSDILTRGLPLRTPVTRGRRGKSPPVSPLYDDGDGHLITFAPTGAGKGVSCIIPALLAWDGPAIVIDPKGEAYAVTAARRRAFGHAVHVFDPFNVTGAPDKAALNPLDLITPGSATAADDAAVIARLVTQGRYFTHDPFWDERAETLITGLILYVLTEPPPLRSLAEVRWHIDAAPQEQNAAAQDMLRVKKCPEMRPAANILAASLGENRTRWSILSTASSHMSFLRAGPALKAIQQSTLDLEDVRLGNRLTIYLVLPPDKLASHGKLLRLWLGTLMMVLSRRRHRTARPTLLLIDEAAQLGPMQELRTAVTLMRGYGVRCWSFWQDLSQLQRIYPLDWKSIVNNCAVQQYFGLSTPQAAAEIDDYLAGASPRPIAQISDDDSLLIRRGHPAQIMRRPNYLRDAEFAGTYSPNPFFGSPPVKGNDLEEEPPPLPLRRADNVVVPFPERGTR